jgi:chromate transporter
VLPYVTQAAVLDYRWLQPGQMIDGLALGETTPGPLIMVVAFVGFLAGSGSGEVRALIGGSAAAGFMAGAVAATLVTWFTFLPSFIFILAGGPLVERTRHELAITGPLTAVTAAVVGVIVSLGLFFGYHVWWPGGRGASLDLFAITLTAAAAVALLVFRQNLLRVIGLAALAGLIYRGFPF